ncbi:MAG: sarcosine oxidase, gamma subunit family [Devosia sp.]|nr:sarcosine oxidase, gamma subunit family [Devosia sp.]
MPDLTRSRLTPLSSLPPAVPGVSYSAAPAIARLLYRGSDGAVAAGAAFGVALPTQPCSSAIAGDRATLWLGPDEWLLLAPEYETLAVQQAIAAALPGIAHAVVDISHRQVGLRLDGPRAAAVLNAGVPLDLSLKAFPVGMVTRTIFEKAEIILWRTGPVAFRVEVWRSFAPYVMAIMAVA